jgi:hypothetical protein
MWFWRYLDETKLQGKKCTEPEEDSSFGGTGPCRLVNSDRRYKGRRVKQSKKDIIENFNLQQHQCQNLDSSNNLKGLILGPMYRMVQKTVYPIMR